MGTALISMQEAFEHSSNIGIAKQVVRFYQKNPSEFYKHIQGLNLTSKLKLQIAGETKPAVLNPNNPMWSCSSLPSMSIGYGLSFTPLQLLSVYNAVANNGKLVKPLFVSNVTDAGKTVKQYKPTVLVDKICSESTLKQLRAMMEGVVLRGTASEFKSAFYSYAGKTGTAVIANDGKGYDKGGQKFYRASFCGYFPADAPKYSCMVLVSKPLKHYYAAQVALPVFKDIADKVYATSIQLHANLKSQIAVDSLAHIPPVSKIFTNDLKQIMAVFDSKCLLKTDSINDETEWSQAVNFGNKLGYHSVDNNAELIPDVKGMGIKDALYMLESKGVQVQVVGAGKVTKQSVPPNTPIKQVKKIVLQLGKA
jgi:cell division protein FtsI (penicillin-binding protein 3)